MFAYEVGVFNNEVVSKLRRGRCLFEDSDAGGGSRAVFLFDDFVIKFAIDGEEACNVNEALIWKFRKETKLEHYIAPVLAYDPDGTWIVMDRLDDTFSRSELDQERGIRYIEDKTWELGMRDLWKGNIGWSASRQRWEVLDYGYPARDLETKVRELEARCN